MELPKEYTIDLPLRRGTKGRSVKLVQEWLSLCGFGVAIDGSFGPATEAAVRAFSEKNALDSTGVVNANTFAALIAPITRACSPIGSTPSSFRRRVITIARRHNKEHPREVGGQNAGPWVRLYTGDKEGPSWPWCAGFVSTILRQAAEGGAPSPLKGSLSCDVLAAQATKGGIFVREADIARDPSVKETMRGGAIFLVRNKRNASDWIHTGFVTAFHEDHFETIEGNTNDAGDREGYEVCIRRRGYGAKDFIRI